MSGRRVKALKRSFITARLAAGLKDWEAAAAWAASTRAEKKAHMRRRAAGAL